MENNIEYYDGFEAKLTEILLRQCTSGEFLDGTLLEVEELDEKWREIAPEYMVDAVPQIGDYPTVAVAWAAYVGMGLASIWDGAWEEYKDKTDLYSLLRDPRGFDAMDEYIAQELLGLAPDSSQSESIAELLLGCARSAVAMIRNEQVEPQSTAAFYIFARTTRVMFRLGVALELRMLGYKYEKVKVQLPQTPVN